MKNIIGLLILFSLCNSDFIIAQDTLKASQLGIYINKKKKITKDIDLKGGVLCIPKGVTLAFNGGMIKNGTIVGDDTQMQCKGIAFDKVTIKGVWNVPSIYSTWFKNLSGENALRDVIALSNPRIKNRIIIDEGEYVVSVSGANPSISIYSNTDVILNGTIKLKPNSLSQYYIINLTGKNISLSGKGMIVGDKYAHTGNTGEWGMGVNVRKGQNISIRDITIKDCWGDCIYVGTSSENVEIEGCTLIDGRRQGISVTSAKNVYISNCKISKVRGTAPQYAIDIEPNKGDSIDNVFIRNVEAFDCYGGFLTYGKAKNAWIGNVTLEKCSVYGCEAKYPVNFQKGKMVKITDCYIDADKQTAILFQDIDRVQAGNNRLKSSNSFPIRSIDCKEKNIANNIFLK